MDFIETPILPYSSQLTFFMHPILVSSILLRCIRKCSNDPIMKNKKQSLKEGNNAKKINKNVLAVNKIIIAAKKYYIWVQK